MCEYKEGQSYLLNFIFKLHVKQAIRLYFLTVDCEVKWTWKAQKTELNEIKLHVNCNKITVQFIIMKYKKHAFE